MSHLQPARLHPSDGEGAIEEREGNVLPPLRGGFEWGFENEALPDRISRPLPTCAEVIDEGSERLSESSLAYCWAVERVRRRNHRQRGDIGLPSQGQRPHRVIRSEERR